MTSGLGKILKQNTKSTNHKEKLIDFLTLKQTTSGIPKYPTGRMKSLAQGDRRVQKRQKPHRAWASGPPRLTATTQEGFSEEVEGDSISLIPQAWPLPLPP